MTMFCVQDKQHCQAFVYMIMNSRLPHKGGEFLDQLSNCGRIINLEIKEKHSIATGYGLDGPGIESLWGRDFSHSSSPALGPTQPPVQWIPGLSQG
jgi:hypothetical protein